VLSVTPVSAVDALVSVEAVVAVDAVVPVVSSPQPTSATADNTTTRNTLIAIEEYFFTSDTPSPWSDFAVAWACLIVCLPLLS
jgi:hypothetical protein